MSRRISGRRACAGALFTFTKQVGSKVRVRFRNDGGKSYARCEAHLVYRTAGKDSTQVTFAWSDDGGPHRASHSFPDRQGPETSRLDAADRTRCPDAVGRVPARGFTPEECPALFP